MKVENPFDQKIEANRRMPEPVRAALVDTIDTLDFVWAGVQAVFEKRAKPEHAVALLPLVMAQADAQRQRQADEYRARMDAAAAPPPVAAPRKRR